MTPFELLFLGLIIGAVLVGIAAFCYLFFKIVRDLISQLDHLSDVLAPLFESHEVRKGFAAFQLLAQQGEDIGRKIESLDKTAQIFIQRAFVAPTENPLTSLTSAESGVFRYSEEDAAARDAASKLRKAGVETDESRVSASPSEAVPSQDVF